LAAANASLVRESNFRVPANHCVCVQDARHSTPMDSFKEFGL
jgi:hypothetical protein